MAAIAMMAVTLGGLPAHAAPTSSVAATAAGETDPIDPPLYDATSAGGKIRVNVVTEKRADVASAATAGETVQAFEALPVVTLKVDAGGLDELSTQPGVVSVTEDLAVSPSLDESVPLIGGDKAIKSGMTGAGSAIAILDTGVSTSHPFLKDRVIAEACFSSNDPAYGSTSLCPNGSAQQEGAGSANVDTGPCATIAQCDHGTHVAGIAAGNGTGVAGAPASGVAPGANLIAIQVFSKFNSEQYCGAEPVPCVKSFASSQIAGLEKVWQLQQAGTPVVAANLSLGGGVHSVACDKDARKPVIDRLLSVGVATVAAAGNNALSGSVNSPACVASAIAVGSSNDDDEVSSFSNRGALLDFFAPGNAIISSVPGREFNSMDGTSMAAPHVAGAFAVLRQKYPEKSITELEALLKSTGKTVTDTDTGIAVPRIDIGRAVGGTDPTPPPAPDAKPRPSTIINDADMAILDLAAIHSPITVTDIPGKAPKALQVHVDATHDWRGEVKINLIDPAGKSYLLKASEGTQNGGTIDSTYTVDASTSTAKGTWKLRVEDRSSGGVGILTGWSLTFPSFEKTGAAAIPDLGRLNSDITVDGFSGKASAALQVHTDITHEWVGDLKISLIDPNGKSYLVKSTSSTADATGTFTVDASTSPAAGTWRLEVQDTSTGATGTLNGWSLTFPAFENQANLALPDPGALTSSTVVKGIKGNAPKELKVYVDATHDWLGDVEIYLVDPSGALHLVKADSELESGGNLKHVYTVDASAAPAAGTWGLRVEDVSAGASGSLNEWSLSF
ncbi:proprotein convertase P-domain-containing protein [Streptomyces sp. NPDC005794]|uniref:proprotein convertase P-domain-containing protein n=1 Tax=Streptomyces sp. NPDC005794 TaxID=3364733 RepID=UPI00367A808D